MKKVQKVGLAMVVGGILLIALVLLVTCTLVIC